MLLNVNATAAKVEQLADYTFTDKLLAAEAVQMAKLMCGLWFNVFGSRGNELNSSDWTTLRNGTLGNGNLAQRGCNLGADVCVFCKEGTVASAKTVASTLEAIVGAVYQDSGDNAVLRVINHLGFTKHLLLMTPATLAPGFSVRSSTRASYRKAGASLRFELRESSSKRAFTQISFVCEAPPLRFADLELIVLANSGNNVASPDSWGYANDLDH